MKKNITAAVLFVLATMMMVSCHTSEADNDYSYAADAALTSFYVSGAKQYLHTTSSTGEDSVYTVSVTGSNYKFYIDQLNGKIYNPDSLPYGTDASHIVVGTVTKNGSVAYLKQLTDEDLWTYVSSDSIDFSQPRTVRVLAQNGQVWRDYEVKVNVHQQDGDAFVWNKAADVADFQSLQNMRLAAVGMQMLLLGTDGASTKLFQAAADGSQWTAGSETMGAEAWNNAVVSGQTLFVLDGTVLKAYADGEWTVVSVDVPVVRLVAAGSGLLFGYDATGKLLASENGATWTQETLDDTAAALPSDNLTSAVVPLKTTNTVERIVLAGTVEDFGYAQIWSRMADVKTPSTPYNWTFVDTAGDYRYAAPAYEGLTLLPYDGFLLATGLKDGAVQPFLLSRDNGITWKAQSSYPLPEALTVGLTAFAATVDADNYIWVVTTTGEVWRGRLNRLGFED